MSYSSRIIEYFSSKARVGSLDASPDVGTGLVGAPACGDVIKLQISVENGVIQEARYKTFGCMAAMASSAYLAEMVEGKSLDEVSSITNQDVAQYLGLPAVKVHCSCLVAEVLQAAIADYKSKQSRVAIKRNVETRRALCAVTERAADYLKGHGRSDFALTTKTQGCMGTGYAMEFATPEVMDFECVSMHGINIYIRPESELFLAGVTIDYEVGDDKDGLVFNNPNETRKCKCGEAFYMD